MPRSINALDLLRRDHRNVEALLKKMAKADEEGEQRQLCEQIVEELRVHAEIEERVLYPWLREATAREDLFQEASIEHDTARQLMEQLPREQAGTPRFKAMARVLGEVVQLHVQEEENEIFPAVEKTGVDLLALGQALQEAREGRPPDEVEMAMADEDDADGESEAEAEGGDGQARPQRDAKAQAKDDARYLKEHEGEGLSKSTERAFWIHGVDDRPERDGQTLATRNLDVIRAWAEERGGRPATTGDADPERPRVLRIDFPDYSESLQEVSWDAWGRVFEERDLVFLFQQTRTDGRQSNFFRLDSPEREDG